MRYLLLMVDDGAPADGHAEPIDTGLIDSGPIDTGPPAAWQAEMDARGVALGGARLRPPREARTVRRRGGETVVVDGPYPESREHVAGLDLVEAADLDEAIEVAGKHPAAQFGLVEIRPLWHGGADLDLAALARI